MTENNELIFVKKKRNDKERLCGVPLLPGVNVTCAADGFNALACAVSFAQLFTEVADMNIDIAIIRGKSTIKHFSGQ